MLQAPHRHPTQGVHSSARRKGKLSGKIGKVIWTTFIGNIARESRYWQPEALEYDLYAQDKANGSLIYLLGPSATIGSVASTYYPSIDVVYSSQDPKNFSTLSSPTPRIITPSPGRLNGEKGSVKFEVDAGGLQGRNSFLNISDPTITVNGQPLGAYLKVEDPALIVETKEKGTFFEFIRREWIEFGKSLRDGQGPGRVCNL
ncbi:hypothetical protein DFP72DRAFT_851640 [Ephemerocybe angulata]|uniref:Uncharacterized protein n=1 Tax=Ephemerocybe angulata TaxID=980116 RepID=A0A8H6M381_9AGAR|nr:hypothetical protein DFP72DRAFT_851640 [Tulosesus angulatus]